MTLPNRTHSSPAYRYGFGGHEKDDEVKGQGNSYTTQFRQYDARVGRWLTRDPLIKHNESPFASFSNNPIWFVDRNGADSTKIGKKWYWKVEKGDSYFSIGQRTKTDYQSLEKWNIQEAKNLQVGTLLNLDSEGTHFVYESLTPEIYRFTKKALAKRPNLVLLTYNGGGGAAAKNRYQALKKFPPYINGTKTRDEFPYASTFEGGSGADVFYAPVGEQNMQAQQLRALYRGQSSGFKFFVVPVPTSNSPEPAPVPVPVPVPGPSYSPIKQDKPVPVPVTPVPVPVPILQRVFDKIIRVPIPIFVIPLDILFPEYYQDDQFSDRKMI